MNPNKITTSNNGKNVQGVSPSIVLINPRFAHNVGMVVRLASCYGMDQVWFTGSRVGFDLNKRKRLPREERMKGYKHVQMLQYDYPLDQFNGAVPVAVEVRPNSERLHQFEHPENAVYIFGPEDGSIPSAILNKCHRFLIIPTVNRFCLNLATAVATVLWDRTTKLGKVPETDLEPLPFEETDPEEMGLVGTEPTWP